MLLAGNKDPRCYVCGPDNPVGLRVQFDRYGTLGSRASYTARAEHAGWAGILHGGVIFALMDEALGWSLYFQDIAAVTAGAETRFHKSIPVGTALIVAAQAVRQRRHLFRAHAEVRVDGPGNVMLAETNATMYVVDRGGPAHSGSYIREAYGIAGPEPSLCFPSAMSTRARQPLVEGLCEGATPFEPHDSQGDER
jgi:acyl-coenzyme A thioesterase PaaI-like protein